MKKKKLNTLNIFGDSINSDVALSRNEMKKIMAGSGQCDCYYGDCYVTFGQVATGWSMAVCCSGDCETYSGSGQYGGTMCGGQCP